MNRKQFLNVLKRRLKRLKKDERNKYLEYYDEIISDIMESGVSEAEAIKRQGSIDRIAEDILLNTSPGNLKGKDFRGIALVAASLILLLCSIVPLLFRWQFEMRMSTSIGVIGGADGPTSIFLAGKIGTSWGLYIATVVVVLATITYFMKKHGILSGKLIAIAGIVAIAVAAAVIIVKIMENQSSVSTPFGHTFCVDEVVYSQAEEMSFNFVVTETTVPLYSFTSDEVVMHSIVSVASRKPWRTLGVVEEMELTEDNFDVYFGEDSPVRELRSKNEQAWLLEKENGGYYLLQQKNGDIYLAYWDDSMPMEYIVVLSRADYVTCTMETQGTSECYEMEWYPGEAFGIYHKQVPLCVVNGVGTLEFSVDDDMSSLYVEEKRIFEQVAGYREEEVGNYNLARNKEGKFILNVSSSGVGQDEFAMYYVHCNGGIYVIEVKFR